MTAYRQQALACVALLRSGPGRPAEMRAVAPDAGRILLHNVYGWFERRQRGVYQLTAAGEAALRRWPTAGTLHDDNKTLTATTALTDSHVSATPT